MKKPKLGMFSAMKGCLKYRKLDGSQKKELQNKRLHDLVAWAKDNSPYYSQLYKNIGEDYKLSDLPPVNKVELMAHWDNWVTDPRLKLSEVMDFMKDLDNIGRKFKGEYLVFTTSGSTGNPLVAVCDKMTDNVMGAINAVRSFAHKEDMKAFIRHSGKTIGVFATGGFYLGNSSVRSRLLKMPWKKRQMAVTSALLPVDDIVKQLNEFQPAMLGGYPSNLELLIEEQKSGMLHISPVLIMTGGENLSDELRERLSEAFGCHVQTSYSCTEGGTIACECGKQHFHINDDWIIVEPVDKDNKPVPSGVRSDKILLTNLFNYTQPFIRYEVSDRVLLHEEICSCGNPAPYLSLEGRNDDVVSFIEDGKTIKLAPLAIYATLKEVHQLKRFQLLVYPENMVHLRLEPVEGVEKKDAYEKAVEALTLFFQRHGLKKDSVTFKLSEDNPKQDAGSGKFKHIINVKNFG